MKVNTPEINQNGPDRENKHMQENMQISKVDKKKLTIKKEYIFTRKIENVLCFLKKYLKIKAYKMLERQTNADVSTLTTPC